MWEKVYARGVGDSERVARVSVNTLIFFGISLQSRQYLFSKFNLFSVEPQQDFRIG